MKAKIFYRERRTIADGEKKPRFRIVGVANCNLKVYADHLRLSEIKHMAKEVSAEAICLEKGIKKAGKKGKKK